MSGIYKKYFQIDRLLEAISKLFGVIINTSHFIFFPLFVSAKSGAKSSPRTPTLNWLFTHATLQSRPIDGSRRSWTPYAPQLNNSQVVN
jgi:hypothetical protein